MLSPRSSNESLHSSSSSIPSSDHRLPPALTTPMVWRGDELNPTRYVVLLSERDIEDIRAAVIRIKLAGTLRADITRETFALRNPELVRKISTISKEVHDGTGVAVLRGLDEANFNDEEAVIAFVGICTYVGAERATDSYANQTLSHIRDATKDVVPLWARGVGLAGSKVTTAMDFHSDRFSGDVLALHVRNDGGAGNGGEQYVASFWTIYNALLEADPAVLETMAQPDWPFELKQKNNAPHLELGPTLFFSPDGNNSNNNNNKPMCQFVKAPLLGTPLIARDVSMPPLTARQTHAMAVVDQLAQRFCTRLDRQQGDIQFLNNLSILHARGAYRANMSVNAHAAATANGPASSRHLLRIFLRDASRAWPKPLRYAHKFDDPFAKHRQQNLPVVDSDPWRMISGRESHG